uniref:Uncharacterized protein n=1 Tax=Glossina brevipalpis TaxID=37001 RepID=A0A1A9WRK0_9MUSC
MKTSRERNLSGNFELDITYGEYPEPIFDRFLSAPVHIFKDCVRYHNQQIKASDNNDDSTDASLSNWLKCHQQANINLWGLCRVEKCVNQITKYCFLSNQLLLLCKRQYTLVTMIAGTINITHIMLPFIQLWLFSFKASPRGSNC